ncbi:hypothetical protein [Enterocloster bolteae]|jgi:phage-related protein|uniref:hypothetical protein n=1 Tax=Enterocloster bolteae TaxID=208479 RepID=UPI002108C0CB|nr:hypothetical protein [Enterocloster bolteae]MCQ5146402.1 hypothetical protein [Enterocloster bolteae]
MAADGSIIIDTKINSDGITAGAKDIQDGVDRMALALKNANKEILKFIDDYEKGLNQSTASTNEFRKQIESLKKQLKSMESKGLYFGDEDYDNTYLQLQKVQQALKDYKKELVSPTPDAMSFDSSSLEGQIERLSNKLVKLREQGKGFGDETFDSAYKSLIKVQEELKEYKKNLTKKEEPIQLPMVVDTSTMEGQINLLKAKLEGLRNQGKGFGDSEFDSTAQSLKRAEQALAEYKNELFKTDAQREKEAETARNQAERQAQLNQKLEETKQKEAAAAAESARLRSIGESAQISTPKVIKMRQELEALTNRQKDLEKAGVGLGNTEYDQNIKEINRLKGELDEYRNSLVKTEDAQNNFNKTVKDTTKSSNKGRSGLLRMMGTGLLMGVVFQGLYSIMGAMKEGMDNLAQYSGETNSTLSSLMSSLTQLKNAFATAFSPILTVVAPALNYLIGLLTSAATAVAQLISALTGKNSFVKATKVQQDYAASLEKTGGAAKETEGALAAFDKLDVAQDNSGGGGSGGELSPEEMFETVPVDNSLTQAIDMIKQKWLELSDLFKKGFVEGIGDLSVLDSIKDSISSIKSSLLDIFTDNSVTAAFQKMVDTLVYNAGRIAGSFVSVGLTIADNILGGFSKFLNQNKDRIKSYLISMFDIASSISTIQANFAVAVADIFTVFRSDTAKQVTADIISIFSNTFMGINELVGKLFRDVINLILTPFTENADAIKDALNNTLAPVEEVLGTIANSVANTFDAFNRMYDEHLAPLFESLKDGLSDILTSLLDGYNKYIAPVLDKISKRFTEVWEGTIQPLIENAIGLIGDVADLIKAVWENILQPVVNWFVSNMYPVIAPIVEDLASIFLTNFEDIGNIFNDFMDTARAVIQFITYIFSVDWNSAWEGVKKSFKETFESLPGIVKGVIEKVISSVETMINGVIRSINSLSFDIPDWVPKIGGQTFGFQLDEVHLPRLASGTVVPPRAGEFAAILGDNPKETEVVSPLSTMKQALKEAILEVNGVGGGDIHLTVNLEGKAIYDTVVKRNRMEKNRTGSNPLLV